MSVALVETIEKYSYKYEAELLPGLIIPCPVLFLVMRKIVHLHIEYPYCDEDKISYMYLCMNV